VILTGVPAELRKSGDMVRVSAGTVVAPWISTGRSADRRTNGLTTGSQPHSEPLGSIAIDGSESRAAAGANGATARLPVPYPPSWC